eukprot:403372898
MHIEFQDVQQNLLIEERSQNKEKQQKLKNTLQNEEIKGKQKKYEYYKNSVLLDDFDQIDISDQDGKESQDQLSQSQANPNSLQSLESIYAYQQSALNNQVDQQVQQEHPLYIPQIYDEDLYGSDPRSVSIIKSQQINANKIPQAASFQEVIQPKDQINIKKQEEIKQMPVMQSQQNSILHQSLNVNNNLVKQNNQDRIVAPQKINEFEQKAKIVIEERKRQCIDCYKDFEQQHNHDEQSIRCKACTQLSNNMDKRNIINSGDETIEARCQGYCEQVFQLKKNNFTLSIQRKYFCNVCKNKTNNHRCPTCNTTFQIPFGPFKDIKERFKTAEVDINQFTPKCIDCTEKCKIRCNNKCKKCFQQIVDPFIFQGLDGICWACFTPKNYLECLDKLASYELSLNLNELIYIYGEEITQQEIDAFLDVKHKLRIFQIDLINNYPSLYNWYQNLEEELKQQWSQCNCCYTSYRYKPHNQFKEYQNNEFCSEECQSQQKKQQPRNQRQIRGNYNVKKPQDEQRFDKSQSRPIKNQKNLHNGANSNYTRANQEDDDALSFQSLNIQDNQFDAQSVQIVSTNINIPDHRIKQQPIRNQNNVNNIPQQKNLNFEGKQGAPNQIIRPRQQAVQNQGIQNNVPRFNYPQYPNQQANQDQLSQEQQIYGMMHFKPQIKQQPVNQSQQQQQQARPQYIRPQNMMNNNQQQLHQNQQIQPGQMQNMPMQSHSQQLQSNANNMNQQINHQQMGQNQGNNYRPRHPLQNQNQRPPVQMQQQQRRNGQ